MGLKIIKTQGGLGRRNPSQDNIGALVLQGAPVSGLALGDYVELKSIRDLENLGINAQYDTDNKVLVHYHVSEVFRLAPSATLYLMLVAQDTVTLANMCDKTLAYLQFIVAGSNINGAIRAAAVGINPGIYTPTLLDGLDNDVIDAIPKAQALADQAFTNKRPVDTIIIEGRNYNGSATAALDLRTEASANVSICIGQDLDIGVKDPLFATHACVGTALGMVLRRAVDEDLGQILDGAINDPAIGAFARPGLSNGQAVSILGDIDEDNSDADILDGKGYIYCYQYIGQSGVYFNDSHTCTALSSDFAYIENNRSIGKASRLIYSAIFPKLKGKLLLNTDGTLRADVLKELESIALKGLDPMMQAEEISDAATWIDPTVNVITAGGWTVKYAITPVGIGRTITAEVGFSA
jgi:hypothetical protein